MTGEFTTEAAKKEKYIEITMSQKKNQQDCKTPLNLLQDFVIILKFKHKPFPQGILLYASKKP